jgi:hypothetical protein
VFAESFGAAGALTLRIGRPFAGNSASWGPQGSHSVLIVGGSHAHVSEDAEALSLDYSYPVESADVVGLRAAAAAASSAAHRTYHFDLADTSVATAGVVEGGVAEEGVASIDRVVPAAWGDAVHGASVALEEVGVLDSMEQERRMRLTCHVPSDAIRLAEGELAGALAAPAHCIAAVAASIAQAVLSRRRLSVRLGSQTMLISAPLSAVVPQDQALRPPAFTAHAVLTSQYFVHCARYGWYILPSVLTCCPGLSTISCAGVTYTMGGSRGYD